MQTTSITTARNTSITTEVKNNVSTQSLGFKKPENTRYERLNCADKVVVDAAIYNASSERDIVRIIDAIFENDGRYSKLVDVAIEEFRSITGTKRLH